MSSIKMNIKQINYVTTWQHSCFNRECPICRTSIDNNVNNIIIGTCGHGFHSKCIQSWHNQMNHTKNKCPVCNKNWQLKLQPVKDIKINNQNNYYTDGAHSPPFQSPNFEF